MLVVFGYDYVILLICILIMVNIYRFLVRGYCIFYKGFIDEKLMKEGYLNMIYRYFFYIFLVIIVWLFWLIKC